MKNYLVFYGDCYYPKGGMDDFIGDFDTIKDAKKAIEVERKKMLQYQERWATIWSVKERKNVFEQTFKFEK
jgi:hypothetical protein